MEDVRPQKKHFDYIDVAKVIGIILVTYAHIKEKGHDIAIIYSFHLPMFFVIAGITLSTKSSPGEFIFKKIKGYLIPILFLDLLAFLVDIIFMLALNQGNQITIEFIFNFISNVFSQYRLYPIWFVVALMVSVLFAYFVVKACKEKTWIVAIASVLVLAFAILYDKFSHRQLPYNIDVAFFGTFFVLCGWLFRQVEDKIHLFLKNRLISLGFAVVFIAVGMTLACISKYQFDKYLEMWGMQYQIYYLVLPAAVFNSFGFIFLANTIANPYLGQFANANLVILTLQQGLGMRLWKDFILKDFHYEIAKSGYPIPQNVLYAITGTMFTLVLAFSIYTLIMLTPLAYCLNQKPIIPKMRNGEFKPRT